MKEFIREKFSFKELDSAHNELHTERKLFEIPW
jgi:hypothetical protein